MQGPESEMKNHIWNITFVRENIPGMELPKKDLQEAFIAVMP